MRPGGETLHWVKPQLAPREMVLPQRALEVIEAGWKDLGKPTTRRVAWKASDLVIRRDSATSNFYDVAGNRVLALVRPPPREDRDHA